VGNAGCFVGVVLMRNNMNANQAELYKGSIVRTNLLTVPGYAPYCGSNDCSTMKRTEWDVNAKQFVCNCGWISNYPPEFVAEYVKFRIDSQVCSKCGVTVGENKSKYCGDGSDKDNPHKWTRAT
jgi:hypothetical protein